jgi:hypothetical protein
MLYSDADFDAKLVRFARFAFADALHLGGVQGIQLVLVLWLLTADALSARKALRLGCLVSRLYPDLLDEQSVASVLLRSVAPEGNINLYVPNLNS